MFTTVRKQHLLKTDRLRVMTQQKVHNGHYLMFLQHLKHKSGVNMCVTVDIPIAKLRQKTEAQL